MDFQNQKFERVPVHLDGNVFKGCEFKNCEMVFCGVSPFSMSECKIIDAKWTLQGPAELTLSAMQALCNAGARDLIAKTFENIMSGKYSGFGPSAADA